jgi:hypothetical protein
MALSLISQRASRVVKSQEGNMEVKCLELRDHATFIPVICIRPVPENEAQRYLLRRDGYRGDETECCIIMIDAQCRGVSYDPYNWPRHTRTKPRAHLYIEQHWHELKDGDVIDVEFILGERPDPNPDYPNGIDLELARRPGESESCYVPPALRKERRCDHRRPA